jgi:uncharacterized protein YggE
MKASRYVLLVPLVVGLAGCRQAPPRVTVTGNSPYGQEGIRVSATALVRTEPELAVITLGCDTRAPRARDARARNEATISAIVAAIEKRGVARKDIRTVDYTLNRAYGPRGVPQGWVLTNMVEVRARDVKRAADIVDGAADAGANVIRSVRYEVNELRDLRERALAQACSVALQKAERVAKEMGVKRGKLVSFADQSVQAYSPYYSPAALAMANAQSVVQGFGSEALNASPDRELSAGQIAVNAHVEAVFEVE